MWWKVYVWLLAVALFISYLAILVSSPALVDFIDIPISIVAWLGLFAFAYRKRLAVAKFWQAWFFVIVIWDIVYNGYFHLYLGIGQQIDGVGSVEAREVLFSLILLTPEYVALYLYGYKRTGIWTDEPEI